MIDLFISAILWVELPQVQYIDYPASFEKDYKIRLAEALHATDEWTLKCGSGRHYLLLERLKDLLVRESAFYESSSFSCKEYKS